MTPDENNPKRLFRVGSSAKLNEEVKGLALLASSQGKRRPFLKALRQILTRLTNAPLKFGECRYQLPNGKLRFHIGAIQPAAVQFAIHEESATVILLKVYLLGS